ncbi:hypothetical protein CYJ73_15430 [Gordonia terrae]|uniref:Uncharacterized protein n=1 Tax=Gordonia terrae TaxID=2055 RepID=A0A2I1R615_9ACTN|nr:hypothetical protein CYJ73_15430 [Gordonia terrae]
MNDLGDGVLRDRNSLGVQIGGDARGTVDASRGLPVRQNLHFQIAAPQLSRRRFGTASLPICPCIASGPRNTAKCNDFRDIIVGALRGDEFETTHR